MLLLAFSAHAAPVRVMSWDLQPGVMARTNDSAEAIQTNLIQQAAENIKKANPDVVLLQQVANWEACNQLVQALKPDNNYTIAVCSAFRDPGTGTTSKGQAAILSKSKAYLSWSQSWQSNAQSSAAPGGFAFAAIKLDGKNVGFFSVQMSDGQSVGLTESLSTNQQKSRELAAGQLLKEIAAVRNWTTNRLRGQVVAGDFNTSVDDGRFAREKTLPRIRQSGLQNILTNLPPEKRVTLPGAGGKPDSTVDYIFTRNVGTIANVEIVESTLTEHFPVAYEMGLEPLNPKPATAPQVAQVAANAPAHLATNETKVASTPAVAVVKTPPLPDNTQIWKISALVMGVVLLLIAAGWMGRRSGHVEAKRLLLAAKVEDAKTLSAPSAGRIVVAPIEETQPIVHIEIEGATQTQGRAAQGQRLPAEMRAGLTAQLAAWLKSKFVRRLVADRAKLLEVQQVAALKVMAVDERLTKIEHQIAQRNRDYEQRIDALLRELAVAREENRELIRAKIAALKAEMEKNAVSN